MRMELNVVMKEIADEIRNNAELQSILPGLDDIDKIVAVSTLVACRIVENAFSQVQL